MSSTKLSKMHQAASSPEARAKAVATMKRRRAEKLAAAQVQSVSLDDIPDSEPKAKAKAKAKAKRAYATKGERSDTLVTIATLLRTALVLLEQV